MELDEKQLKALSKKPKGHMKMRLEQLRIKHEKYWTLSEAFEGSLGGYEHIKAIKKER